MNEPLTDRELESTRIAAGTFEAPAWGLISICPRAAMRFLFVFGKCFLSVYLQELFWVCGGVAQDVAVKFNPENSAGMTENMLLKIPPPPPGSV